MNNILTLSAFVLQVLMLLAWQQLTSSSRTKGALTYWSLAGVHGKTWAYNGVESPST